MDGGGSLEQVSDVRQHRSFAGAYGMTSHDTGCNRMRLYEATRRERPPPEPEVEAADERGSAVAHRSVKRFLHDAGMSTQNSDVDSVVFGRDLDFSDAALKDPRTSDVFAGRFGKTSRQLGYDRYHITERRKIPDPGQKHPGKHAAQGQAPGRW